jgi:hypothetical protein
MQVDCQYLNSANNADTIELNNSRVHERFFQTYQLFKLDFQHPVNLLRKPHADAFSEQASQGGHIGGADGRIKINSR